MKWKDQQPDNLFNRLMEMCELSPDGSIIIPLGESFTSFETTISILRTAIDFEAGIVPLEASRIVREAFIEIVKAKLNNIGAFKTAVQNREQNYLSQPYKEFYMVTNLNLTHTPLMKPISLDGVRLTFRKTLPKKFDRTKQLNDAELSNLPPAPEDSVFIVARISSRSVEEAMVTGVNSIETLKGIWNLAQNRSYGFSYRRDKVSGLNKYYAGPIFTLHKHDGSSANSNFWYEGHYPRTLESIDVAADWHEMISFFKWVFKHLSHNPDKQFVLKAIRSYSEAMDHPIASDRFASLWASLEQLTCISATDDHKMVAIRGSALFAERPLVKEMLNQLRMVRNEIIHSRESDPAADQFANELRMIVEYFLNFHIVHKRFNRREEGRRNLIGQFLSCSSDATVLDSKLQNLKREKDLTTFAKQFHNPKLTEA